ncbi:MAG TPA: hypothetical protein VFT03_10830, partial [Rubrobacteraceae bacterium]|nr:hypothetical protein [Rubrobacteraceae bacterium]
HLEGGAVHGKGGRSEQGGHKQCGANSEHHTRGFSVSVHLLRPFFIGFTFFFVASLLILDQAIILHRSLDSPFSMSGGLYGAFAWTVFQIT